MAIRCTADKMNGRRVTRAKRTRVDQFFFLLCRGKRELCLLTTCNHQGQVESCSCSSLLFVSPLWLMFMLMNGNEGCALGRDSFICIDPPRVDLLDIFSRKKNAAPCALLLFWKFVRNVDLFKLIECSGSP